MVFSRFTRALLPATLLALGLASLTHAEEKSFWQKFKDFFSPTPTVEGEGPEYDKLRELDKKINTLEGKYSRERRPNNKANIRKEIDKLKEEREALAEQLKKNPPQSSSAAASSTAVLSASQPLTQTNSSAMQDTSAPACKTDTVFVRDTVVIYDTLYVIVADKKATEPTPETTAAESTPATPTDSSKTSQPGTK